MVKMLRSPPEMPTILVTERTRSLVFLTESGEQHWSVQLEMKFDPVQLT